MFGISIDSPQQNSALISKLQLPFPILSDPDRQGAISRLGVADPNDERDIARPATIIVAPDGREAERFESRDFADRMPERALVQALRRLGLSPTTQEAPELGPAEPGPKAMPLEQLAPYYRGARFAVVAMSRRHPQVADDAADYIAELDRYSEAVGDLSRRADGGS